MAGFKRATKSQSKLRMALIGVSGSGKTYTALKVASKLGKQVALVDTERGSASKYADLFGFDVLELENYHPQKYIEAIKMAQDAGYDVLVIDSLSHAWSGKDGALELVDKVTKRTQSSNSFGAWREVTPLHNAMVDAILGANLHVIVTIRAKTDYVQEKDPHSGKTVIRKVGLQPVQRDGLEYEFDVVGDMTIDNDLIVSKTRCPQLSGGVYSKPGDEVANTLISWLSDGTPISEVQTVQLTVSEAPDELNPPENDEAPDLETPPTGTGALGQIYDLIAMAPDAHAVQVKRRFLATHKAERLEDIPEDKLAAAIPWFKAELAK